MRFRNWWEKFNHRFDHPVLIFHQGLSPLQVAQIRESSRNRVWFANVDRYFQSLGVSASHSNHLKPLFFRQKAMRNSPFCWGLGRFQDTAEAANGPRAIDRCPRELSAHVPLRGMAI